MWNIFKVFSEFVAILLLFYAFLFFLPLGTWDRRSPTRGRICTSALEGRVLSTGPPRKAPTPFFWPKLKNSPEKLCGSQSTVDNSERGGSTRSPDLPLRNLYAGQEATVRTGHGTTDWFQIRKAGRQGCILSPCLFNLYAEYIRRNAGLEEAQARIKNAWRNINNLRHADDTTLMQKVKKN